MVNKEKLEFIREQIKKHTPPTTILGKDLNIHPTAVLGEPGHTMAKNKEGYWQRAEHHGGISICDRVHIGEYSLIKRATLEKHYTFIDVDTKICSYVNVGHNCRIGKHCFIGPHVCLNGSVDIGDNCWIAGHAVIGQHAVLGDNVTVGMGAVVPPETRIPDGQTVVGVPAMPIEYMGNYVAADFKHGKNLEIGKGCHIHPQVEVGDNCTIRSHVELREGTAIGDDCYIDSGVKTSGQCRIGDNVTLRYDSIIARGTVIEDDVFIAPQLMTENLDHRGDQIGGAHIGEGVFIGTNVTLASGITVCPGAVIGSKANVRKDIDEPGVYVGNPVRRIR